MLKAGDGNASGKDADRKYKMVPDLSVADVNATKVFPDNLEFEARETFTADTPGAEIENIAPDPKLVTLIVHHSLVKLPPPAISRAVSIRASAVSRPLVADYGAPLGKPIVYRLAERHRLEKIHPAAAPSRVKKPIVYYVDRAAPEPIRDALIEGASWWAKAFDEAGFIDAFQVKVMPEGMDPLDVRYNVINWVNRATRGWSYGQSVVDPRTGEIIKGSVLLGSLRVRQDMLIFEGLVGADKIGSGGPNDPKEVALARLRQLAAHETGHTLGFSHNFAGSTLGPRLGDGLSGAAHRTEERQDRSVRCLWRRRRHMGRFHRRLALWRRAAGRRRAGRCWMPRPRPKSLPRLSLCHRYRCAPARHRPALGQPVG